MKVEYVGKTPLQHALQAHWIVKQARPDLYGSTEYWETSTRVWKRMAWEARGGDPALDFDGPLMGKARV